MDKEEWLKRYKARMIERGLCEKDAEEFTEANEPLDFTKEDDPEGAADDELSYWVSDG